MEIIMSFAQLKKNRSKSFDNLIKQTESLSSKGQTQDDRFWKVTRDKAGNGYAIIRFLPPPDGEDFAYVRKFDHGFQGNGGWYIEECPTTINKDCPACEHNRELWNSGVEANQKLASSQKRRTKFISNILVVDDSSAPENNGKVFLFSYGVKIFEKIQAAIKPEFPDETPFSPFDFWEGADFKLKVSGIRRDTNYDKSVFESPAEMEGGEKAMKAVYEQLHSLQEFVDVNNYKEYEDLDKRLNRVLGLSRAATATNTAPSAPEAVHTAPSIDEEVDRDVTDDIPFETADDDDADMALFEKLANE